jgi:hypothetical protein
MHMKKNTNQIAELHMELSRQTQFQKQEMEWFEAEIIWLKAWIIAWPPRVDPEEANVAEEV